MALMVALDAFLNPKHTGKSKEIVPQVIQYLGSKLGMTRQDLAVLSPKLASQINESYGSETSSRKRPSRSGDGEAPAASSGDATGADETGDDPAPTEAKKPRKKGEKPKKKEAAPKASRKRKGQPEA